MKRCLVSVIVPAHNAERFIAASLSSALSQTLSELEVVVVDDASSDRTVDIVEDLARRDNRIVLVRHQVQSGPGAARNTAIAASSGDWIAVLDADDTFERSRLERLVNFATVKGADLVADNLRLIRDGALLPRLAFDQAWFASEAPLSLADIAAHDIFPELDCMPLGFAKPVINREFLDRSGVLYAPDVPVGSDFLFTTQLVLAGGRYMLHASAGYDYTLRQGSVSRSKPPMRTLVKTNRKIIALLPDDDIEAKRLFVKRLHVLRYELFKECLDRHAHIEALSVLAQIPVTFLFPRLWLTFRRSLRRIASGRGRHSSFRRQPDLSGEGGPKSG